MSAFQAAADDGDHGSDPSEFECQCPNPGGTYLLEIDEGAASVVHAACHKAPAFDTDLLNMAPTSVRLAWEKPAPCQCRGACDCDRYAVLTPAPELAERARATAVALEQENARLQQVIGFLLTNPIQRMSMRVWTSDIDAMAGRVTLTDLGNDRTEVAYHWRTDVLAAPDGAS